MVIHPGSTLPVLRVEHVPVLAEDDLELLIEVAGHGLEEGRPVADVYQVLTTLESDDGHHVHIRTGHIRAADRHVIAEVAQELGEVRVVGVAGASEVVSFDAVEVLLEGWDICLPLGLFEVQLGDVFEGNPRDLGADQPLQVVEGGRHRLDLKEREIPLEGVRPVHQGNNLQSAEYSDETVIDPMWQDERRRNPCNTPSTASLPRSRI
jgi:hypothetical protein